MAERIGVIAGGRLIAEGTLDELRGRPAAARASRTSSSPLAGRAPPRDRRPAKPRSGSLATSSACLARLAAHDDRRQPAPAVDSGSIILLVVVLGLHLPARMVGRFATLATSGQLARQPSPAASCLYWSLMLSQAMDRRPAPSTPAPISTSSCPRRCRPPALRRPHRRQRPPHRRRWPSSSPRPSSTSSSSAGGRPGSPPTVSRLRRRRAAAVAVAAHRRAVPAARASAHAAGRSGRGRRDRRSLRHRHPGRRHPLLRHARPARPSSPSDRRRHGAATSKLRLAAGPRGPRRPSALAAVIAAAWSSSSSSPSYLPRRFGEHALAATGISQRRHAPASGQSRFRRARRPPHCAARNGCCSAATPGSGRKR